MTKTFQIITDSSCDLPQSLADELDLRVLPLHVTIDGKTYNNYLDGREIAFKDFFDKLRAGSQGTTRAVNPEEFRAEMEPVLAAGLDVLYVGFSSGLSTTYQSGCIAADELREKYPERKILTIDSLGASLGEGLVVYLAAKDLANGAGYGELVKKIRYYCDNMEHIFTIDTFEYLYRGGRVSRTVKVVGGLLGIKPILHVDEEGHLVPIEKTKGRKKAFERMVEIAGELCKNIGGSLVGINHFDDPAAAEELKAMLSEKYGCSNFLVSEIGSAIGAHSGPGTVSIYFISD